MLISVHLPKTAGSSFVAALEGCFGEHLKRDYKDVPMNRSTAMRNFAALRGAMHLSGRDGVAEDIQCVHGHYMPIKYRLMRSATPKQYVTWMRDPVERLASHYHYWRRTYNPESAAAVHRRVVEDDWTLERFCLSPEMRNTYSKFLWGFSPGRFAFIGITEDFAEEMRRFSYQVLKNELSVPSLNRNPSRDQSPYITDPSFRQAIEQYHQRDMALYQYALNRPDRQQLLPAELIDE